jgi:hypothetical protein
MSSSRPSSRCSPNAPARPKKSSIELPGRVQGRLRRVPSTGRWHWGRVGRAEMHSLRPLCSWQRGRRRRGCSVGGRSGTSYPRMGRLWW